MSNPFQYIADIDNRWGSARGEQFQLCRVGASTLSTNPDYTVFDQTPFIIKTYKYVVETATDKYAQINAPDVEFYTVRGKRGPIKPGDILIPTYKNVQSTTPIITVIDFFHDGTCMAIKTSRTGDLYNGSDKIFSNIKFDFLPRSAFPGTPLDREIEASLGVPSIQAVIFARNLRSNIQDPEGLFLYQTDDGNPEVIWEITAVTQLRVNSSSTVFILDMKRNAIR